MKEQQEGERTIDLGQFEDHVCGVAERAARTAEFTRNQQIDEPGFFEALHLCVRCDARAFAFDDRLFEFRCEVACHRDPIGVRLGGADKFLPHQ